AGKGPIRTGVTAILPTGRKYRPVFASHATLNGNGELTGTAWIDESGFLEEPILFTNTHSVGAVYEASIHWRREHSFHESNNETGWASLPVVGETWDGRLNDIHGHHVKRKHVFEALDSAQAGPVPEGNVGGGTGMVCHRFKSGIGTASRITRSGYALGAIVQANYGRREDLTIAGIRVGQQLTDLMPEYDRANTTAQGNSILVVIATDAPLLPHQLRRLCNRVPLGIGRTGGYGANSSGDFFLAFSTAEIETTDNEELRSITMLSNKSIDQLFLATVQATEEAILNALVAAETMEGINGNIVHALPIERLMKMLEGIRE
ncbi:MAG: P1 family peptidase, partial [Opitutales bacterium]|nr:P1 family peptidase [Opitutales bacterium]